MSTRQSTESSCSPWLTHSHPHHAWIPLGKANGPGWGSAARQCQGKAQFQKVQVLLVWKEQQDTKVKHMAALLFQRKKQRGPKDKNRCQESWQRWRRPLLGWSPACGQHQPLSRARKLLRTGRVEERNAPAPEKVPRPSSRKCDLSGLSRYLEIRHQHCDLGRPKNVLGLKRDRKETQVTGSLLGNATEQCQPGRVRREEEFGPERAQEVT